jgi:hypothetical protein
MYKFHMERLHLNKLDNVEEFRVEISNRFAAKENLGDDVDINGAGETIRESIKILAKESLGCYELKMHKPWFKTTTSKERTQIAMVTG